MKCYPYKCKVKKGFEGDPLLCSKAQFAIRCLQINLKFQLNIKVK